MAGNSFLQSIRNPRHGVVELADCAVTMHMTSRTPMWECSATLANMSRNGVQVILANPLLRDERVLIRIQHVQEKMDLELTGAVRWIRANAPDGWSIGCEFDEPLSYELMGELFLRGILNMDLAD